MLKISKYAGILAGAVVATTLAGAAASAETIRMASWIGPKHVMNSAGLAPFGEKMKQEGFDVKFYPGGSLLNIKTTLSGLRDGVAELAVLSYTFYPSELPNGALIADVGLLANNGMAAAAAANEYQLLHCQDCQDEFARNNIVFVAGHATSTYALMSTQPIREAEDLQGKKMRVAGSSWSRWARSAGGVDMAISSSEMFDALNKGNIDIAIHAPNALRSLSLWDVAKYITVMDLGAVASAGTFVFNRDFWQGLTPEQRRMIAAESIERAVDVSLGYAAEDREVLAEAPSKGVEVIEISPSLAAQKQAFIETDLKTVVERADEVLKLADADEKVETLRRLMAKWNGLIDEETPREEVVALVKSHIYDKIDYGTYQAK